MPILPNKTHEMFARLVIQGLSYSQAYKRCYPDAKYFEQSGSALANRLDIKERIAECREIINTQYAMLVGEKRDLLRRMALGEVPTRVIRRPGGKIEAIFDRLKALEIDAKLAGEFAPEKHTLDVGPTLKLEFDILSRKTHITDEQRAEFKQLTEPEPVEVNDAEVTPITEDLDAYADKPYRSRQLKAVESITFDDLPLNPDDDPPIDFRGALTEKDAQHRSNPDASRF